MSFHSDQILLLHIITDPPGLKQEDEEKKDNLDSIMSASKWHIDQMDKVLRLLRNGVLSVEDVEQVKYGIEYYVESNQGCLIDPGGGVRGRQAAKLWRARS